MINRSESELMAAGLDALKQLGLQRWKIYCADEEAETMSDYRPAPDTSSNIRFQFVPCDGRFTTLRIRIAPEQWTDSSACREVVEKTLIGQLRRDHLRVTQ
jgi:hypothetical protein